MNGHPEGKLKILHKGFDNAMLALDWMFKTYPKPNAVAVMGWSVGALASPLYTHIVAQQYPGARVTHFADGGGAYHLGEKLAPLFKPWGTENVLKRVEGFEDFPISGLVLHASDQRRAIPRLVYRSRDGQAGRRRGMLGLRYP